MNARGSSSSDSSCDDARAFSRGSNILEEKKKGKVSEEGGEKGFDSEKKGERKKEEERVDDVSRRRKLARSPLSIRFSRSPGEIKLKYRDERGTWMEVSRGCGTRRDWLDRNRAN